MVVFSFNRFVIFWQEGVSQFFITVHQYDRIHIVRFPDFAEGVQFCGMMERYDIIVRHFLIFLIEGLDEVDIFRDRGDDDDVCSGQILFMESFAEEVRIKLQRLLDELLGERILFDKIIGLVPVLHDSVILVHLLEGAHSQI